MEKFRPSLISAVFLFSTIALYSRIQKPCEISSLQALTLIVIGALVAVVIFTTVKSLRTE